jgi:hypothetical protein
MRRTIKLDLFPQLKWSTWCGSSLKGRRDFFGGFLFTTYGAMLQIGNRDTIEIVISDKELTISWWAHLDFSKIEING